MRLTTLGLTTLGLATALVALEAPLLSRDALAQKSASSTPAVAVTPAPEPFEAQSQLGSYLAGKIARSDNDIGAAARLFDQALAGAPDNPRILEQTFLMKASDGDFSQASDLAQRLLKFDPGNRLAQLWSGVAHFKAGNYAAADKHFKASSSGPIAQLTGLLARVWTAVAAGKSNRALSLLRTANKAEWAQFYANYHRAIVADLAGRSKLSDSTFRNVIAKDPRQARHVIVAASALTAQGRRNVAIELLDTHIRQAGGVGHPSARALRDRLRAAGPVTREVATATEGLAEVFYVLGDALSSEGGGTQIGKVYLRLALELRPEFEFATAALANVYERLKKYAEANEIYKAVPQDSPMSHALEIRRAINLDAMDRVEEAREKLVVMLERDPDNLQTAEALANMLRSRKRYKEAIPYYTKVIALAGPEKRHHWVYWYARGTCYERTKQWPLAEADLLKAKSLQPNQPLILNYLGYSWVDQNRRLKEGLEMIKKAVALKPNDGYIVDSLGWAYYRLGNMKLALKHLERAVELQPEDPILNDHLGDVLWRLGNHREARYQWDLSLSFNPEPEDLVKTQAKLKNGLEPGPAVAAGQTPGQGTGGTGQSSVR